MLERRLRTPRLGFALRMLDRARVLGAAMRVAYIITAGQGGVLPKTPMNVKRGKLVLTLPRKLAPLGSDRLFNRLRQLARLVGREDALPSAGTVVANISLPAVLALPERTSADVLLTSGYLMSEEPRLAGYAHVERGEIDGWAADVHRKT